MYLKSKRTWMLLRKTQKVSIAGAGISSTEFVSSNLRSRRLHKSKREVSGSVEKARPKLQMNTEMSHLME